MSRWRLVLEKEMGQITLDTFNTKKEAEEAVEYRNTLTRHMGYDPDLKYGIVEVKSKKKWLTLPIEYAILLIGEGEVYG